MKEYIFYTYEGYTESPTGKAVENLQILGFAYGKSEIEARKILLNENHWILESGFDENKMIGKQIV